MGPASPSGYVHLSVPAMRAGVVLFEIRSEFVFIYFYIPVCNSYLLLETECEYQGKPDIKSLGQTISYSSGLFIFLTGLIEVGDS